MSKVDLIKKIETIIKEADKHLTPFEIYERLTMMVVDVTIDDYSITFNVLKTAQKIIMDGTLVIWTCADNPKLKKLIDESVRISL